MGGVILASKLPQATGLDYHNGAHRNKLALQRALDALRKIRLGHPCDLPDAIARLAIEDVETILAGGTPPDRPTTY